MSDDTMARHLFLVATYAVPGQAAELDRWYDEQHIPDLLRVPGVVSARRYRTTAVKFPAAVGVPDSMTIYELDVEDPATVIAEMGRRMGTSEMPSSPALDSARTIAFIATPDA